MMCKKKILVLGATGMLGHIVFLYLNGTGKFEMFNSVYRNRLTEDSILCNAKDQKQLLDLFQKVKPDIVVNCTGALVKESKDNPASGIYLNALLPHILKDFCNQYQVKLIHISTDCVFSGKKGNYAEDDFRDADDVYGRSKALGEIYEAPHCTLRTSIIGPEIKENGTGLFHWFMQQKGEVNGYVNALWSGVTTLELAKAIEKAIKNNLSGVFHVTNGEKINKFNLLNKIKKIFEINDIEISPFTEFHSFKDLISSTKFDFEVVDYDTMLLELKDWMNSNNSYNLY